MSTFGRIAQFARVVSSSLNSRTQALQVTLTGIGSLFEDETDDEDGEVSPNAEMFGALGFISRPADPEAIAGKEYACEALCLRTEDGLVPFSWRDLRLNSFFENGVPAGRISMVGYGGGFYAIDLTDDKNGDQLTNNHTIYAPYDYSDGTPNKAMVIQLNTEPGNENITMSIGGGSSGFQMTITEDDGLQVRTPNDETLFNIREDTITLAADKIFLKGNVYVGSQAESGIPLLAGSASPPCPSLFVSPS